MIWIIGQYCDLIDNSTGTVIERDSLLCADFIAENVASTVIDADIDVQKALKLLKLIN